MATGQLKIDLSALVDNWRALDRKNTGETAAVIKADGYGLDSARVARALANAGVQQFFIAAAEEATAIRAALGPTPTINVFSGHMDGDTALIRDLGLTPILNSPDQIARHKDRLSGLPFGVQIDTGMNRLGLEDYDWSADMADGATLVMSHLACADDPSDPLNNSQLQKFRQMTADVSAPKSLSATGGILLGKDYHFDLARPGIGLYGGLPFEQAKPVVTLDLPVIQTRRVRAGETVGYANGFTADRDMIVATVASGYADGLIRAMSGKATLFAGATACPLLGRVSMDLLTVDVTHLDAMPDALTILGPQQSVDDLARAAGTIGYEILTSLGARYRVDAT